MFACACKLGLEGVVSKVRDGPYLGRTKAARGDRVSREVGRGKGSAPVLPRPAGGPVMDAFDRFWQWANKPLESQLTIPAALHRAVMAPKDRRDRAAVNHTYQIPKDELLKGMAGHQAWSQQQN